MPASQSFVPLCCPSPTWVKINVDGAVHPSTSAAAIGGICRSDSGEWIFGFSRRIGCCSILNAELWVIFYGLQYVWRRGYCRVIIESDCREAICCVTNGDVAPMVNGLVVIREWLQPSWEVKVNHIFRQSNMVVDWLAKALRDHKVRTVFFEKPPDGIHTLLESDLQR
ncbi:hypothetical protein V6N11_020183 [Hibiscus sabdariffa]|uniref:Uncharacterized protein n=2 Tax=Hibiscus sabdariffa TaxID=183260 RepID=A0ABR1ZDB0_9ROSI